MRYQVSDYKNSKLQIKNGIIWDNIDKFPDQSVGRLKSEMIFHLQENETLVDYLSIETKILPPNNFFPVFCYFSPLSDEKLHQTVNQSVRNI